MKHDVVRTVDGSAHVVVIKDGAIGHQQVIVIADQIAAEVDAASAGEILHLESPLIPRRAVVYWLPHPRIETILLGERVDLGNPAVPRRAAHLVAVLLECLELRVLRDMPILTFRLDPKPKRHPIEHIGRIAQHPSGGDLPPIELAAPWEAQLLLAAHLPRLKEAVPIPSHLAQRALRGHASVALI